MSKQDSVRHIILLHFNYFLYALYVFFQKKASFYTVFDKHFIFFYICALFMLAVYSLIWQQVLKRLPLIYAYSNKGVIIIWGMLFGTFFFGESYGFKELIGCVLVMIGIVLFAISENTKDEK